MPHEAHVHIFRPFQDDTALHNEAMEVYYNQIKFMLNFKSYDECFRFASYDRTLYLIRHLVIRLE
jgi:Zn-dependent M28 family amino/carboxypeptidase